MCDFEGSALYVGDDPKNDRVHIDRHGVLAQGLLGEKLGGSDAGVDHRGDAVDDRDHPEQPRAPNRQELPGSQHHCLLPLPGHFERGEDDCRERYQKRSRYEKASEHDSKSANRDKNGSNRERDRIGGHGSATLYRLLVPSTLSRGRILPIVLGSCTKPPATSRSGTAIFSASRVCRRRTLRSSSIWPTAMSSSAGRRRRSARCCAAVRSSTASSRIRRGRVPRSKSRANGSAATSSTCRSRRARCTRARP